MAGGRPKKTFTSLVNSQQNVRLMIKTHNEFKNFSNWQKWNLEQVAKWIGYHTKGKCSNQLCEAIAWEIM